MIESMCIESKLQASMIKVADARKKARVLASKTNRD